MNDRLLSALSEHTLVNAYLAFLYLLIAFVFAKKILKYPPLKTKLHGLLVAVLVLVAVGFLWQAFAAPAWVHPAAEAVWHGMLWIAGFFLLRSATELVVKRDGTQSSVSKFDKMKEEFLYVASHELRTPLSVINGFAEILLREKLGGLNDEQKRRIRKILMQGQRLNHIIDEMLDITRIRSGKIEVRRDVFDLVPVLKACLDDHLVVCEQQGINLADGIPDVLPDVVGDLDRVTQVIVNILNNAIKYTDSGGQVSVTASLDKDPDQVRITVKDSGIGIAREDLTRVFSEFYRAQQNHPRKYAGTGLGLSIVRQLVTAQGGKVGVESEGLGKGCLFYFTLPIAKGTKSQASRYANPIDRNS